MRTQLVHSIIVTLVGHTCSGLSEHGMVVVSRAKRQADPASSSTTTCLPVDDLSAQCSNWMGQTKRPTNPTLRAVVPEGYDQYVLPKTPDGGPLPVYISAKVRDIQKIDEQNMEVTIEWYLRLFWVDSGLTPPANVTEEQWQNVAPDITEYIWLPTTYIDHAKEVTKPTLLIRPESFRMKKSGLIRYSMSVTTRMSCPMDFSAYPFDNQVCYFRMESYQFTSKQVSYKWFNPTIERSNNIRLGQFDFDFYSVQQQNTSHTTGSFPLLMVEVALKRRISYHLMNTFLPSGLFVCVSWLTFLVPADQIPGRMVLTITTLLTLVSMFAAVREESPKVSYAKAVDQWMIMCIIFVFLVLFEFTAVIRMYELGRREVEKDSSNTTQSTPASLPSTATSTASVASPQPSVIPSTIDLVSHSSRRSIQKQQRVWADKEMAASEQDGMRSKRVGRQQQEEQGEGCDSTCFPKAFLHIAPEETFTPMFVKVRRPTHTPRPLLHANAPPTPATFPQHLMQLINTATSTQHILQLQPSPTSVKPVGEAIKVRKGGRSWRDWGDRVEGWSLKVFPLLFVVGNLCYWAYWLGRR
ncbi:glutamate-gated chloride channel alpha-like isoform X2 [Portunus trituberculatus]|uniref:glutamate-gated chloride channel alpha-like isoform X2 n=1 Tax=Portunus trituberculatus TaxID=210409 RepID=UPI001E1D17C6|nr:glutamate-gated chloride channel alpha-like isoform X2 [Portunus trituberculatus]